jgi:hypothetical protein
VHLPVVDGLGPSGEEPVEGEQVGDQMPARLSGVDVARHANVSTTAVSKVLRNAYGASPAMRAKVRQVIDVLGYRPYAAARGLRGRTYTIGLMLPNIYNPFFADILDGITACLAATDYQVLLGPGWNGVDEEARVTEASPCLATSPSLAMTTRRSPRSPRSHSPASTSPDSLWARTPPGYCLSASPIGNDARATSNSAPPLSSDVPPLPRRHEVSTARVQAAGRPSPVRYADQRMRCRSRR